MATFVCPGLSHLIIRSQGITTLATFILVHGGNMSAETWNRLSGRHDYPEGTQIGAKYWDGTAAFLREHGHRVFAPALEDEHTHNLTDHIGQVTALMENEDLRDVILVGHSYGGMVITGVADRMTDRVRSPGVHRCSPPKSGPVPL